MNAARFLSAIILTLLVGAGIRWARNSDSYAQQAQVQLQEAVAKRDSAIYRERKVRDSVQQALSEQDAAWGMYVRDLQAKQQSQIQDMARASARRARMDVEARTGSVFAPDPPDTASSSTPCLVTLTCSEAAAWQASDSLKRMQADSSRAMQRAAAAACSTRVAAAMVQEDSIHASRVFQPQPVSSGRLLLIGGAVSAALVLVWAFLP